MTAYKPKWGKESTPPPNIPKNERVIIDNVEIELVNGDYGEQLAFTGQLRGADYTAKAWVKYYINPGDQSTLYQIALATEQHFGETFSNIDEVIEAMHGVKTWIFEVRDHKQPQDSEFSYPRFKVIGPQQREPKQDNLPWKA